MASSSSIQDMDSPEYWRARFEDVQDTSRRNEREAFNDLFKHFMERIVKLRNEVYEKTFIAQELQRRLQEVEGQLKQSNDRNDALVRSITQLSEEIVSLRQPQAGAAPRPVASTSAASPNGLANSSTSNTRVIEALGLQQISLGGDDVPAFDITETSPSPEIDVPKVVIRPDKRAQSKMTKRPIPKPKGARKPMATAAVSRVTRKPDIPNPRRAPTPIVRSRSFKPNGTSARQVAKSRMGMRTGTANGNRRKTVGDNPNDSQINAQIPTINLEDSASEHGTGDEMDYEENDNASVGTGEIRRQQNRASTGSGSRDSAGNLAAGGIQVECPFCKKVLRKDSMRRHLRGVHNQH